MPKVQELSNSAEITRALTFGRNRFGKQVVFRIRKHEVIEFRTAGGKTWKEVPIMACYFLADIFAAMEENKARKQRNEMKRRSGRKFKREKMIPMDFFSKEYLEAVKLM